ncbi:hypothetical protein M758_1G124400 [Ceratodon purpureus]|uniref:Uncharacterized protein n=1 Tax=Ceratodon purpureus TaxID=3225 RepID=A0A8T0J5G2_CERPU|nr:hypothetical protein KC19_1G129000 [Ceratodon purpureus]KAG0629710.1 hypothetical protein M758_1G124400 [Ceratodon purpureus]
MKQSSLHLAILAALVCTFSCKGTNTWASRMLSSFRTPCPATVPRSPLFAP